MKRNITAIVLVFALLLSFAACRKLETEYTIETKPYIVDTNGVTQDVQSTVNSNGETEYFYYDEAGNRITVNEKDVEIATQKVSVTQPTTLSPEAQSLMDIFNDPEKYEEMFEEGVTAPDLQISEDLISDDEFNKIDNVVIGSNGKPVRDDAKETYEDIIKGDTFTIDIVAKSTVNGETMSLPVKTYRNGNDMLMETSMPIEGSNGAMECQILILDGKAYMIFPQMRAYMEVPSETISEMLPEDILNMEEVEDTSTYIESGEVKVNGKTYICDVYEDGETTVKYYYLDGELKRMETISGEDTAILEINSATSKVDKSKIALPKGYLDLATIKEFNTESLFG